MKRRTIYLGNTEMNSRKEGVDGQFVEIDNEKYYKIGNYHKMPDFFMSIVSDSNHWMFISSKGSLTAGRKNRNHALFPYYTDDKIHDYRDATGSKTFILVEKNEKTFLWEPFTDESEKLYRIRRNLYKSIYSNKIIFEEVNVDLDISFQYGWYNSEKFGFVKKSCLTNQSDAAVNIEVLDGIRNILPYGVDYTFQNEFSNLLDAYKKNELLENSTLGLFLLSSIPVDRAEPSEALKATTVWSTGLKNSNILISGKQVDIFKKGLPVETELDIRASRGEYHVNACLEMEEHTFQEWLIIAEINQDSSDVANLNQFIRTEKNIADLVHNDIAAGTSNLISIVAKADGLQKGNEELCYARHFSNTLYNVMRGGIFTNNYTVDTRDFKLFVRQTNQMVYTEFESWLQQLAEEIHYPDLIHLAEKTKSPELERICYEYLPLTFSRRHGDPSRPWNLFSIETINENGTCRLNYEGNWRDIFQNWEALSLSFPEFIEGMISKFLNASTADGYNPYRITREGINWESPSPDDPWAYIGYWGDHQIIYLLKFLEQSNAFHPGKLDELMTHDTFVYANVPYRIKNFEEIVNNPKDTILFDFRLHAEIEDLTKQIGADGRLLRNSEGQICHANLTEKILVTLLTKLSNFIPGAGIWMNTQRPEWNDANNALVGNGVSMVTLYYLRRFLQFWYTMYSNTTIKEISISEEVITQFDIIVTLFTEHTALLEKGFSDRDRWFFASSLGNAGSAYREAIYNNSFTGKKGTIQIKALREFFVLSLKYIDFSIKVNQREDGLYHAYNLISFKGKSISIRNLYEMLEGQVAVLSSGYLSAEEGLDVLNAMKGSSLFRSDQYSYLLYPDRQLPRFIEKNQIPVNRVKGSVLLSKLIAGNNSAIVSVDNTGAYHFNGTFRNSEVLAKTLDALDADEYGSLVGEEKEMVLEIFEEVFDHQSFTGRSGTFYGYEGLGSIYWHMVSKLLLVVEECFFKGIHEGATPAIISKIKDHYNEIKAGIGLYKSPELYGAFPTDAYSHTPANAGVKQPGLTGQVKEDFISRMGELGVRIKDGRILFNPSLLNSDEILKQRELFEYPDLAGFMRKIELNSGQLGFTFCQVPIIYTMDDKERVVVVFKNGQNTSFPGNAIDREISSEIFTRSGAVERINFYTPDL